MDIETSPVNAAHGARATQQGPNGAAAKDAINRQRLGLSDVLKIAGPGVITGAADNDPATIATYSVIGAQNGFAQNWLVLLSTPLLIAVTQMSARIGNVTKSDLATAIRTHYGRPITLTLVIAVAIANLIATGADLLFMAVVAGMLTGVRYTFFIVPFALVICYVSIFSNYRVFSRVLLWLAAIFVAYIVAAFLAHPNWGSVLKDTVIPQFQPSATYLLGAVGLLGTTIAPYLLFWQTSGEIEERRGIQSIRRTDIDICAGMIWSQITGFFIMVATGSVLYTHHANITTAADAARALQPFAGRYAADLFAIGIIGAGLLAIPVLTASTAYAIAGVFGWRRSLTRHVNNAPQFYIAIGLSMLVGVQLAVSGVDPIKALFYSQVLNGFVAPVLVVFLILLTSSRKVMGDFVNNRLTATLGWISVAILVAADAALIYSVATSGLPQ
jgi:NRAMP (natural resistance-associated macrophage protein)-like metal ion transporter